MALNYLGKKYLMHTGYIYHMVEKSENGGIQDNSWIRDTTVDAREIDIRLNSASNKLKKHTAYLDQTFRIQFNFIEKAKQKKALKLVQAHRDSILASGDSLAIERMYEKIAEDIVIIYPIPTIWSTHIYIALDETGKQGAAALCDEKIQQLAWEKHGFRTSGCDISSEGGEGKVTGIAPELSAVMNMPDYKVIKLIMEELED